MSCYLFRIFIMLRRNLIVIISFLRLCRCLNLGFFLGASETPASIINIIVNILRVHVSSGNQYKIKLAVRWPRLIHEYNDRISLYHSCDELHNCNMCIEFQASSHHKSRRQCKITQEICAVFQHNSKLIPKLTFWNEIVFDEIDSNSYCDWVTSRDFP